MNSFISWYFTFFIFLVGLLYSNLSESSELLKTSACKTKPAVTQIKRRTAGLRRLLLKKKFGLLFNQFEVDCYVKGSQINLIDYDSNIVATANISKIRLFSSDKIPDEIIKALNRSKSRILGALNVRKIGKDLKNNKNAYFIGLNNLEHKKNYVDNFSRVLAPYLGFKNGKILRNRIQVEKLLMNKNIIAIDVRPLSKCQSYKIKNAMCMPYNKTDNVRKGTSILFRIKNQLNLKPFKKANNFPVIVYGQNQIDLLAYRAAVFLIRKGFSQVYWYWGGIDDWRGWPVIAPKVNSGVPIVDSDQVQKLLKAGAILVDTRSLQEFNKERIYSAISIPYQKDRLRKKVISFAKLKASGEKFPLKSLAKNKAKPIVFYCQDEVCWSAYKAAIFSKNSGYRTHWYRKGFAEWKSANELSPSKFSIFNSSPSPK